MDDAAMLEAWRNGDKAAGNELLSRHFTPLYRFFRSKVQADVDDLLQRTFLGCVQGIERFEGRSSFRSYLFRVARIVLYEHFRAKRRNPATPADVGLSSVAAMDPSASEQLAVTAARRALITAMQRIPLESQLVLELFYWEGFSSVEIGDALGIADGSVRRRLQRARHMLRTELARLETNPPEGMSIEEWVTSSRDL